MLAVLRVSGEGSSSGGNQTTLTLSLDLEFLSFPFLYPSLRPSILS